jgi:integrase
MGWIKERVTKDGKTRYTAMHRDHRGIERSAGTHYTERQANKAWQRAEAKLELGRMGDPKRGRQTLKHYVVEEWFPNHVIEASTRQNYHYELHAYVLPEFGKMRMIDILPSHVREWVVKLKAQGTGAPTIRQCKVILDAILTTAFNDQITVLHAGKGVATPAVVKKQKVIVTVSQFDAIYAELDEPLYRLVVETDIETGLRWGELVELRVKDLDVKTGDLTVKRVVVELNGKFHPTGDRFLVKDYPKDGEWRTLRLPHHLVEKLVAWIELKGLGKDDLLFPFEQPTEPRRMIRPEILPDPATLGYTEPNAKGHTYLHGTASAYTAAKCRCQHCRNAVAAYRAGRRAEGKDAPRPLRLVKTDGHIPRDWFRRHIWNPAVKRSGIDLHVTPHSLRHAHASWLLAGGADIQVVKDRLGHGSIVTTQNYLHTLPDAGESALKAMDAIRGVRSATPEPGEATLSAEQLAEYEALKNAKEQGEADQATLEAGAQQLVISAHEYEEFVQLRKKMEAMKAALAA